MIERKDLGSWMDGAPAEQGYVPGSALGLPAQGSGSAAPFGRRVLSLLLDWGLCVLVSELLLEGEPLATLLLFAATNVLLITVFGMTAAQAALRLRVVPVRGRTPLALRALVRTAALLLVLPGAIWNRDRQPLHDVVAGTAVVRA